MAITGHAPAKELTKAKRETLSAGPILVYSAAP